MKHLWISIALLVLLSVGAGIHIQVINHFTEPMETKLHEAAQCAREDDWNRAITLTEQTYTHWNRYDAYLHLTLTHATIDQIESLFHEVGAYLDYRELGEYAAANARLTAQIELLRTMEEFSLHNIF